MSDYPEHQKLRAVKDKSQCVGEFIEWLGEQGIMLCCNDGQVGMYPINWPITESRNKLLARFFGIDLNRLEDEKLAMLDEQRALNVRAAMERQKAGQ